jgi:hypothetical protein
MNRIACGWVFAASCLLATAAAAEENHVALFKNVSSGVKVVRKEAAIDATPGMTLFPSDKVLSAATGSAGIVFKDGTLLTVGPSTEVVIRDYVFEPKESRYAFSLYLAKGTAIYSSGKIGKLSPESVKVDTPTATVGVRGTRFIINAE